MDRPDIRWAMMLNEYLDACMIVLPKDPWIINIGCGNSVKWNYFGFILYLSQRELGLPRYVAVDIDENSFRKAKEALDGLVIFITGDARNLSDFVQGTFHVAVFEHPDLSTSQKRPDVWRKIFKETRKVLNDYGCIVLTSFWLNDHIPATFWLERTGYSILYNGKNRYPGKNFDTASDGETLMHDKYLLIAKK